MGKFLKLFFGFFLWGLFLQSYGFFEIVEVMPNTIDDKNLEYITLKNISDTSKSLSGYILSDKKKQYVFTEDVFIEPGEKTQFFRPETKLILNNSNEQIFLHNPSEGLVDEVEYARSTKGNFLSFEDMETTTDESIISDEQNISGEIFISDEVKIETNPPDPGHSSIPLDKGEGLKSPNIIFSLQRPSYITQSGSTDVYICDNEKDECKVNFDLRNSFSSEMPERDYICDIDFGLSEKTGQEGRCNPNTIIFPEGEFEVVFEIWHEDDVNILSEKRILVKNIQKIQTLSLEKGEDSGESGEEMPPIETEKNNEVEEEISKIYISSPRIIVQSGLTGKGRYFYCEKPECKINLNYTKRHKDERCYWDFADNEQSSISTHTRCNPGYITISKGTHDMSLRVYEKGNERNRKTTRFYVYNLEENMQPLSLEKGENEEKENTIISIKLQGKVSSEKILSKSPKGGSPLLTCSGVESCYVNLEGIITGGEDTGLEYTWKLDGEIFSEKLNPKGIWVEGIGEHKIIFSVGNLQEVFYINILQNAALLSSKGEEIQRGGDREESSTKTKAKIKFTQNFFVLKYDGLRISGTAPAGSKIEIYSKGEKVGEAMSNEKGKYRFVSKKFTAGEYSFNTKIILDSGEEIFLENSGNFELASEKRAYWFVSKKKKTSRKSSSKKQKTVKIPSLIMQTHAANAHEETSREELSIYMKIFLIAIISLLGLFSLMHIIFLHTKSSGEK